MIVRISRYAVCIINKPKNKPLTNLKSVNGLWLTGHFLVARRDMYGATWMDICHSDCCSWQGQHEILNTVYRNEKDLTKVSIKFLRMNKVMIKLTGHNIL